MSQPVSPASFQYLSRAPIGQTQVDTKRKRSSLIRSIQVSLLLGPEQVEGGKRLDLEEQTEDI